MRNFQKHPDVAQATRVGEPTLVDPQMVSATSVVQEATRALMGMPPAGDKNAVRLKLSAMERRRLTNRRRDRMLPAPTARSACRS